MELYNPGPSSRRCHSSCGTILAVSDSEDSSEEEEEEEERSRDHIKHGTSSNAAAAGGASENLNKLKADFKPKQVRFVDTFFLIIIVNVCRYCYKMDLHRHHLLK